jgi:hypothetical protein
MSLKQLLLQEVQHQLIGRCEPSTAQMPQTPAADRAAMRALSLFLGLGFGGAACMLHCVVDVPDLDRSERSHHEDHHGLVVTARAHATRDDGH